MHGTQGPAQTTTSAGIAGSPPAVARPGVTRLGWIGTGVMGRSMAGHLLDAGFAVTLFSRSRHKAEPLLARGAAWADSPRGVAEASDVVFIMVGHPADVRTVTFGVHGNACASAGAGADGVLAGMRPGGILVDHTTSAPELAAEIAAAAAARDVASLDAPVSGGDRGAREGTLTVMVGGDDAAQEALAACWRAVAGTVVACGGPGSGQRTKLVNQIAIAGGMIGLCEALLYAHRAGLDVETTLRAITPGAAGSWSLSNLAPRIERGDFAPGFMVEHFVKDMGLALEECRRLDIALPGLALAESLYRRLLDRGDGRLGTQSLVLALAELAGCDWPPQPPAQSP
jgi:3-hydroxyisobutyrate dehydrogenase